VKRADLSAVSSKYQSCKLLQLQTRADSNLPLCVHVPSSSEELSPELTEISAWDLNHNRGLAPLSNHFKGALNCRQIVALHDLFLLA